VLPWGRILTNPECFSRTPALLIAAVGRIFALNFEGRMRVYAGFSELLVILSACSGMVLRLSGIFTGLAEDWVKVADISCEP
jgi:hypothetical protein